MNNIHPTAILGPDVVLGDNVTIEPYAVLDGRITLGDGVRVGPFVHLTAWVEVGAGTRIFAGAAIGEPPQDYSWDGVPGLVKIGEKCILREYVTVHTPVKGGEGEMTTVGNEAFLMANVHIAHNVKIGSHTVVANATLFGGWVSVGENAFVSALCAVHQNSRIGDYAIVGHQSKITQDVPPFMMCDGNPAVIHGLNVVGLRRKGIDSAQRAKIKDAFKMLYSGGSIREANAEIEAKYSSDELVMKLVNFVKASKRGIVSAQRGGSGDD
jgi:UDP-N-acetylglucosamine acyltransferase